MKRVALFVTFATLVGIACKQSAPAPESKSPPPAGSAVVATPPANNNAPVAADPWSKPAPKKDPLKRPLFWRIDKDGKTSYALGTIHVGIDAEQRLPAAVWEKLDASPAFAMETDLNDPALRGMLTCTGCSLRRDLGEKHFKKLEEVLGANIAAGLDRMKPMVAATMVSLHGLPDTAQMDTLLFARAQRMKKKLVYLESATHDVAILEKWMNLKALKVMLDDVEGGLAQTKEMLAAYVEGDDARIVALSDKEKAKALEHGYTQAEWDESMKDILFDRNKAWIAPIEKLHAAGGGFIAVGAAHLIGPGSVLELLTAKGYKIERITP